MKHLAPRLLVLAIASLFVFAATGCPAPECEDDEQQCDGDLIQTCVDGTWGDAEECPAMESCMEMESGLQHCMAM